MIGDRDGARHRLAASRADFLDDRLGGLGGGAGSGDGAAHVVHDDLGSATGQKPRMLAAQSNTSARYDCNSSRKVNGH